VEPFANRVRQAAEDGRVRLAFRHRVDDLVLTGGEATGVTGSVLAASDIKRGEESNREIVGDFSFSASSVMVTSGGIGGNFDLVRRNWPSRMGTPPKEMISGVPAHVDGRMLGITETAGAAVINRDRMWHYTEGIRNWDPIWPHHGIRILPGPSSLWLDARGSRLPAPLFPGFDTLGTLEHIMTTGYDYTWFILTQKIIEKEFALSGSEQNPDLTDRSIKQVFKRVLPGATPPVEAFKKHGEDFVVSNTIEELVSGMNAITEERLLDVETVWDQVRRRDRELRNKFTKDLQIVAMRATRAYRGDRLIRVAKPHRLLDPKAGPLIAVRLNILTRKTLGGLHTDLSGRVLRADGSPLPGLYAAGEVAGFGGGGMHGYRSLEGTFLGGCIYSGRQAARAIAGIG
ncbi:MAG: FAD-binding dehydrogenase, partial [Stackebrandtia sp.]